MKDIYFKFLRFCLTIISKAENKLWRYLFVCSKRKNKK